MTTGILIVAHKPLAGAFLKVASGIYGHNRLCHALDIDSDEACSSLIKKLNQAYLSLGTSETLVLTDVSGATPSNVAKTLLAQPNVQILSGLSLPLLLKMLCYQEQSLSVMVSKAKEINVGCLEMEKDRVES